MAFDLLLCLLCSIGEYATLVDCNNYATRNLYVNSAGSEVYTAYSSVDATAYHHIVALLECVLELTNLLLLLLLWANHEEIHNSKDSYHHYEHTHATTLLCCFCSEYCCNHCCFLVLGKLCVERLSR
jgi:hypothetical protein